MNHKIRKEIEHTVHQDSLNNDIKNFKSYSDLNNGVFEILSVDDTMANQIVVEQILTSEGYVVVQAFDGAEAFDLIESREWIPDLILLDVKMHPIDGYEVCKTLRLQYSKAVLPIIMVSGNTSEGSIVQGFSAGSNDYVTKPFHRSELLARIETQLNLKKLWLSEIDTQRSNMLLRNMLPMSREDVQKLKTLRTGNNGTFPRMRGVGGRGCFPRGRSLTSVHSARRSQSARHGGGGGGREGALGRP